MAARKWGLTLRGHLPAVLKGQGSEERLQLFPSPMINPTTGTGSVVPKLHVPEPRGPDARPCGSRVLCSRHTIRAHCLCRRGSSRPSTPQSEGDPSLIRSALQQSNCKKCFQNYWGNLNTGWVLIVLKKYYDLCLM